MGNYSNNKNKNRRPIIIEKKVTEKPDLDVDQLLDAITDRLSGILDKQQNTTVIKMKDDSSEDDFDTSDSLKELAQSMIVQRGDKSSNFEDLGKVKENDSDNEDVNRRIDLLKGLDD